MQSTTSTNTTTIFRTRSPPTQPSQQPVMEGLDKLERLAVARLQHHVNELQLQVDNDLSLKPPVRKTLQCVCDETALTASIPDLKRFIAERSITMLVPLSALDALDKLKKGTDETNIHAREAIRYFDRAQTPGMGRRAITGVRIQDPKGKFATWAECVAAAPANNSSPSSASDPEDEPPARMKDILNCAIFLAAKRAESGNADDEDIFLVTNDEILKEWAEVFNVRCISSNEVVTRVKREEAEYQEKKRHYEYSVNPRTPTSPTGGRGGRGGGIMMRGGRGSPIGFARSPSWRDPVPRHMDPNGFGRGGGRDYVRDTSPPDYVLRSPPRGVARGRGKLWEP